MQDSQVVPAALGGELSGVLENAEAALLLSAVPCRGPQQVPQQHFQQINSCPSCGILERTRRPVPFRLHPNTASWFILAKNKRKGVICRTTQSAETTPPGLPTGRIVTSQTTTTHIKRVRHTHAPRTARPNSNTALLCCSSFLWAINYGFAI